MKSPERRFSARLTIAERAVDDMFARLAELRGTAIAEEITPELDACASLVRDWSFDPPSQPMTVGRFASVLTLHLRVIEVTSAAVTPPLPQRAARPSDCPGDPSGRVGASGTA